MGKIDFTCGMVGNGWEWLEIVRKRTGKAGNREGKKAEMGKQRGRLGLTGGGRERVRVYLGGRSRYTVTTCILPRDF
jgi:hypothetical protein